MKTNSGLSPRVKKAHMKQLASYREEVLRKEPKLRSLFLELTAACNEHCRHCGSNCGEGMNKDQLKLEDFSRILEEIKEDFDLNELQLCITGGEPLLYPHFFELMKRAKELGFHWGMTSNGTLITPEVAKHLEEVGLRTVSISVDGLEEVHDWFRQSPGSFAKTLQGIRNLQEVRLQHVQVTTVVHQKNYHQLEDMYRLFSGMGLRSWRVVNIEPIGRARENEELLLTKDQYRGLFDFINRKRFAGPMEVTYGCSHYLGVSLEREVRPWYFLCNAGVYTASIASNGDILSCLDIERRPELRQGNVRKERFSTVWKNGFEIFRTDYRRKGKCKDCPEYAFCAGDSFHTWDFDMNEPQLCMKGILFE